MADSMIRNAACVTLGAIPAVLGDAKRGDSSCPEVSAMPATLDKMTDAELDARLIRLYRQHRAADGERRADWHRCIAGVLAEQSVRLDRWLAER